jgi:hypothetical protein
VSRLDGRTAAGMVAAYRSDATRVPPAECAHVDRMAAELRDDVAAFGATHPADAAMGLTIGLFYLHAVLRELGIHSRQLDAACGRLWAAAAVILEAEGVRP